MPTSRSRSTALTCRVNQAMPLIVFGGEDDSDATLKTVEMLDMTNRRNRWKIAHDMPQTLCSSSGIVAGDYVYVLGGWSKCNTPSSAALRCRIEALMKSTTQPNAPNVWETLPDSLFKKQHAQLSATP